MNATVVIGHGDLPVAMKQTIQMIAGDLPNLYTVSLRPEDGKEEFEAKLDELNNQLQEMEKIVIIADLLGGSPANGAFAKYVHDDRVELITGMNLPMVLTSVMTETEPEELISEAKNGIQRLKEAAKHGSETKDKLPEIEKQESNTQSKEPYTIVNVRVDARGIHGQVATQWIPKLDVDRVVVIDDLAIADETQKMALKMAKPNSVKLSILSAKKAVARLADKQAYPGEKIMVIIQRIDTLEALANQNYFFETVNMGNVPNRPETTAFRKTVHLLDKEVDTINHLIEKGTHFTAQMVPSDQLVDFDGLIKEKRGK